MVEGFNVEAVALAAIGLTGTIMAFVVKPLFVLLKDNTKASNANAAATTELVKETRKGNKEAAKRNGHLGEQNVQIAELVKHQNTDVKEIKKSNEIIATVLKKSALIAAEDRDVLTGGTQLVGEQIVAHQTINKKGK